MGSMHKPYRCQADGLHHRPNGVVDHQYLHVRNTGIRVCIRCTQNHTLPSTVTRILVYIDSDVEQKHTAATVATAPQRNLGSALPRTASCMPRIYLGAFTRTLPREGHGVRLFAAGGSCHD